MKRTLTTWGAILLGALLLSAPQAWAQEEDEWTEEATGEEWQGWFFGADVGAFFANKHSANYHNGTGQNNVQRILDIPTFYNQIKEVLLFDFEVYEYPQDMRYNLTALIGLHLRHTFSSGTSIISDIGFANMRAVDRFTLILEDPSNPFVDPTLETADIYGEEKRFMFNIGLRQDFNRTEKIQTYLEGGLTGTSVRVTRAEILIRNLTYSIVNPVDPNIPISQQNIQNQVQGGFGMGYFAGGGMQFKLKDNLGANIGATGSMEKIDLSGFDEHKLHVNAYIRLIFIPGQAAE